MIHFLIHVSINVWSGREMVNTRIYAGLETWMKQFPEINIYVDFLPRNYPQSQNVKYIQLGDRSKHIWFPNGWQRAQPRFLEAMIDTYMRNDTHKWYVFGDDDTYLSKKNLFKLISQFDPSEPLVFGRFYCAWPDIVFGKNHSQQCLAFPQGGAGVVISRGFMKRIFGFLSDCNRIYNHKDYAGSMRFGKCVRDNINSTIWAFGKGIQNYKSQFFSRPPLEEIESGNCFKPPISFHQITPSLMKFVHYGFLSEFKSQNTTLFVEWSHLTCRPFLLRTGYGNERVLLRFGYAITTHTSNKLIASATSEIYPLDKTDSPRVYRQDFGELISVIISCENVSDLEQTSVSNKEGQVFFVKARCDYVK